MEKGRKRELFGLFLAFSVLGLQGCAAALCCCVTLDFVPPLWKQKP